MPVGNPRDRRAVLNLSRPGWALLVAVLVAVAACAPVPKESAPPLRTPSKVISEAGMEFFVYELKFPGTSQDLTMKIGASLIWVPLETVQYLLFSGLEQDNFRQVQVILTTGEQLRGEVFVGQSIQGKTDVGYWNMPLKDVRNLAMGSD